MGESEGKTFRGVRPFYWAAALVAMGGVACSSSTNQSGAGQFRPGQWGAPGQFAQGGPTPYAPPPAGSLPPVMNDPINNLDMNVLRQRAGAILAETEASLPPNQRARVDGIPLQSDPTPGAINAYAGCDDQGTAFMATTDGLLEIAAFSARFKANDEVFNSRKLDGYTKMIAENATDNQPLPRPQQQFIDAVQDMDGRKVARQNVLFDAELAFVLGHELGHHYLGHTGCANGINPNSFGAIASGINRVWSSHIPTLNQPNEIAADTAGTYSALTIGSRRPQHFQEEGAMLILNLFLALENNAGGGVMSSFLASHPRSAFRIPWIQTAANTWRSSGGNPAPVLGY